MKRFLCLIILLLISSPVFGAVNFDGTNDEINCGNISHNVTAGYSMSMWVYHTTITDDDYLAERHESTNGGYLFFRDDVDSASNRTDGYKIFVQETSAGGGSSVFIMSAQNSSVQSTWTHVAWTYKVNDGSGLRLYINGVEDANSPVSTVGLSSLGNANNEALELGAADAGSFLNGKMDEVGIWNATLTQSEIELLYSSKIKGMPLQIQPSSLLAYYPLDDHPHNNTADSANGLVFKDRSSNGNDGTSSGGNAQAEQVLSYP